MHCATLPAYGKLRQVQDKFCRRGPAALKGEVMRSLKRVVPLVLILLALLLAGCGAAGPHRIYLDRYSTAYRGMSVTNFSQEDVEALVRYFATQRGYQIKFANGADVLVQQELADDSSLLWVAEKPGSPAILFMSSNSRLTVSFVGIRTALFQGDDNEYPNVLFAILRDKFGGENVHLESTKKTS
jgi:hypothetical protein